MNKQEFVQSGMAEAAKGAPPVIVAATANVQSWSMADVVTWLTVIYLLLQIAWLIWKWSKAAQTGEVKE
ncbi:hypothetical protein KUF54_03220 [Comamonas sp. Y33R10-2]|uniref:hypothetical protein n=1 Tax=Comamonas sp. Y33R10-2 TaxID=2853257 RepID=UPI001C5C8CC9|nr:hypothetical protein [Comamonas sp. Y33R10-2]QXZ10279.1 hypothetical protein KUF54_03220 [Comamonas sp. Y33R10-2]